MSRGEATFASHSVPDPGVNLSQSIASNWHFCTRLKDSHWLGSWATFRVAGKNNRFSRSTWKPSIYAQSHNHIIDVLIILSGGRFES